MKILNQFIAMSLAIFASANVYAVSFEVIGPCSEVPVHSGDFSVRDLKDSVGKISLAIFEQRRIPYIGSEAGFNSILGTPTGIDSIEVISDTKMRAHGWCYAVNGVGPDVLAGDYFLNSDQDRIVWFFGYSTYDNGQWVDYCVPSHTVHAKQFCSSK